MSTVNKVIIVGRVGKDPDGRHTASGQAVATVSVATSERWKDKSTGEKKEQTEWHRVVFWERLAEVVGEYVKKGDLIYVEGKLQTRKYTDKDGVERYTTEIRAGALQMLSSARDSDSDERAEPARQTRPSAPARRQAPPSVENMEDDIPF